VGTLGWVFITGAFLILIMIMNNSWPWVWSKVTGQPINVGQTGSQNITPSPGDTNPAPTIPGTNIPIPGIGAPSGPNPPALQIPDPNNPGGPPLNVYG